MALMITGLLWETQSILAEEVVPEESTDGQAEIIQSVGMSLELEANEPSMILNDIIVEVIDETLPEETRSPQADEVIDEEYLEQTNNTEVLPSLIDEGIVLEGKNVVLYRSGVKQ